DLAEEFAVPRVDAGKMADDLRQADDRDFVGIEDDVAAGGAHLRATKAKKARIRCGSAGGGDQLCAVRFARGFPGGDEDLACQGAIIRMMRERNSLHRGVERPEGVRVQSADRADTGPVRIVSELA